MAPEDNPADDREPTQEEWDEAAEARDLVANRRRRIKAAQATLLGVRLDLEQARDRVTYLEGRARSYEVLIANHRADIAAAEGKPGVQRALPFADADPGDSVEVGGPPDADAQEGE